MSHAILLSSKSVREQRKVFKRRLIKSGAFFVCKKMDKTKLKQWIDELIEKDELWRFYKSKEFMKLKGQILKSQHYECQICREQGIITRADTVHHVQYVRTHPELALSEYYEFNGELKRNLIAVCKSCHNKIHTEKGFRQKRTIKVVTGLPGAGKTTYVKQRRESYEPVYDLDYIVKALALEGDAENLKHIANGLLYEFINQCEGKSAWIIRTAPGTEELRHMMSKGCVFIDLDTSPDECRTRRNISEDEFERIEIRHEIYLQELKSLQESAIGASDNSERW